MKKVAISIGDLNGIGIQLALQAHESISKLVEPIYSIDEHMLQQASKLLTTPIPSGFQTLDNVSNTFNINPGIVEASSGQYSFDSFTKAINLAKNHTVDAICTLPIHKKAWELANIQYKGHTDALRDIFKQNAIMMLGCEKMYVALFTEHMPLNSVASSINTKDLTSFLINFYNTHKPTSKVAVLGLNPHAGDDGVLGNEEVYISEAINNANKTINSNLFVGPIVPDIAFTPKFRSHFSNFVAMYHDQGLAPLKALHFDESINVSLNLPILRTSVDHGTAFDIAYKNKKLNDLSYINAIKYIANKKSL